MSLQICEAEHYSSRDSVCWHEAGHTVVSHALGELVRSVRVRRSRAEPGDWLGITRVKASPIPIINYACINIAGNRSQHLFARAHVPSDFAEYEKEEVASLIMTVCEAEGDNPTSMLEAIIRRTDEILKENADAVAAVHDALSRNGTVRGNRLAALLASVRRSRND